MGLIPRLRSWSICLGALAVLLMSGAAMAGEGDLSPQERASVVEALEASQRAFDDLVAGVSEAEWARKPAPDKWSVGEVAEHILLTEDLLYGFIEWALAAPVNPDWAAATAGKMERIRGFLPDRSRKAQAPGPLQPAGELTRADCLERFAAARTRTLEFAKTTDRAIKRHTWPHPSEFFGDLSVYQWLHFVAAHNQRHNGQIEEVRDHLAGIVHKGPAGFSVEHRAVVEAPATEVYRVLVEDVGRWWQSEHTFSGDASNLSIDARPGGCFCEALPNGGGVTHLTVIHADPGRLLRLSGGLGPLQSEAVSGSLSWSLDSSDGGTNVTLTYNVSGLTAGGLEGWAAPVAGVLKAQFDGLISHVGSQRNAAGSAGSAGSD